MLLSSRYFLAGVLLISVFLMSAGQVLLDDKIHFEGALTLYAAGMIGWAAYLVQLRGRQPAAFGGETKHPVFEKELPGLSREILIGLLILITAAFFRFYHLDGIPPGFNHDAAMHCEYAIRFDRGLVGLQPYYVPPSHDPIGYETLQPLLTSVYIRWLGVVPLAAKLASATTGLLTVGLVYFFVRRFFGVRLAQLTAFFLAVCGWHFIYSRVGWHCISVPLGETAALFAFWVAVRGGGYGAFALAGGLTAVNLTTYSISRLLLFKFGILYLFWIWRGEVLWRKQGRQLLVFAAVFVLCASPVFYYAANHWDAFQGRTRALLVTDRPLSESLAALQHNLATTVLSFNDRGNGDDFIVDEPLLDFPLSLFFTFGLVWILIRFKEVLWGTLFLWWLTSLLPGMLSNPNPNHNIGALVPTILIAATGALMLGRALEATLFQENQGNLFRGVFTAAFVMLVAGQHYRLYLDTSTRRDLWGLYPETRMVGSYIKTMLPTHAVYVANNYPMDILIFMTDDGGDFQPRFTHLWNEPEKILIISPETWHGKGMVFIAKASPENAQVFADLRVLYPSVRIFDLKNEVDLRQSEPAARVAVVDHPEEWTETKARVFRRLLGAQIDSTVKLGGGVGNGNAQFQDMMGLAVDSFGNIFAADMRNQRIQKLDPTGKFILSWGSKGEAPGQFNEPRGMAMDSRGYLYVADSWNQRVQQFDATGKYINAWKGSGWFGPKDIAVTRDRIYVADTGNNRIEVLDLSGHSLALWGGSGKEGETHFRGPVSVCAGVEGAVYVLDAGNACVHVMDKTGKIRQSWPVPGWVKGEMVEAFVRTGKKGVYVTSPGRDAMWVFPLNGAAPTSFHISDGPTGLVQTSGGTLVGLRAAGKISVVPDSEP